MALTLSVVRGWGGSAGPAPAPELPSAVPGSGLAAAAPTGALPAATREGLAVAAPLGASRVWLGALLATFRRENSGMLSIARLDAPSAWPGRPAEGCMLGVDFTAGDFLLLGLLVAEPFLSLLPPSVAGSLSV